MFCGARSSGSHRCALRAADCGGGVDQDGPVLVVVISGPIASGKSALGREVATRLEEVRGIAASPIDLDLVYEMLDPRRRPKENAELWAKARRVAGRLATALLAEGRWVVAEGDFAKDHELREFEAELPNDADVRLVMLEVSPATALERARADPTRGISKDNLFLSAHYDRFMPEWRGRDVLRVDTGAAALSETARSVVEWLCPPPRPMPPPGREQN